MADKYLRGKQPLTFWRGANGQAGGYLYRGGVLEPAQIDAKDAERLVAEGFLEWVVRDGESFRLAEDTDTGAKGDPVSVGDNGFPPESEVDLGTFNEGGMARLEAQRKAEAEAAAKAEQDAVKAKADAEVADKRKAAAAKLPQDGSAPDGRAADAVFVEYLVRNGYARDEVEKADRNELRSLAASVKK